MGLSTRASRSIILRSLFFTFKNWESFVIKNFILFLRAVAIIMESASPKLVSERIPAAISEISYLKSIISIKELFLMKSLKFFSV